MLVYEFVSNGSLFQNLLEKHSESSHMNLRIRLAIATESAEALSYLHSSINRSIVHGDIKSQNILLDEKFTAKVSDFGAAQLVPLDEAGLIRHVQGTFGYLDREYLQSGKLTDKSDVYSFGVVLVELITGKMATYTDDSGQMKILSSVFINKMTTMRLRDILDAQILEEEQMSLVQEVAELAKSCLSISGEERPTMKDIAEKLNSLLNKCRNNSRGHEVSEEQGLNWQPRDTTSIVSILNLH